MGDLTEHFSKNEFACTCGCGFDAISLCLVNALEKIRSKIGISIIINSGCRCKEHNKRVGGKVDSSHLSGLAADIRVVNSNHRFNLLKVIYQSEEFRRIGIGKNFIHVDIDYKKALELVWVY